VIQNPFPFQGPHCPISPSVTEILKWLYKNAVSTAEAEDSIVNNAILLALLDPWRWSRYVIPKHRKLTTNLNRVTSQKCGVRNVIKNDVYRDYLSLTEECARKCRKITVLRDTTIISSVGCCRYFGGTYPQNCVTPYSRKWQS